MNPAGRLERPRVRNTKTIEAYSPEEVWALARAADDQDAATFIVAAFCGLRIGELLALRWREVDFTARVVRVRASYTQHRWIRRSPRARGRCRWPTRWRGRSTGSRSASTSSVTATLSSRMRRAITRIRSDCAAATGMLRMLQA